MMESFLLYLLRASVCMVLFYGFYKLFLSRTTFYAANRSLLMLVVLMVALLPLFRYNLLPRSEPDEIMLVAQPSESASVDAMPALNPKGIEIPWAQALIVVYLFGLMFVLVRCILGIAQIRRIIAQSERQPLSENLDLCISDKVIAPFSWMSHIVISRADFLPENESVIAHEKSHVLQKHSWDRLLLDAFVCVFWFNPFSWLLRREMQSVHEFQADEYVLNQGLNAKQYQLLLIRKSVGEHTFALANNFLRRDLQKRIKMMMKNKTNPKHRMAYLATMPVILLGLIFLSAPELNAEEKSENLLLSEKSSLMKTASSDSVFITANSQKLQELNGDTILYLGSGKKVSKNDVKVKGRRAENVFISMKKNEDGKPGETDTLKIVKVTSGSMSDLPSKFSELTNDKNDKTPIYIVEGKKVKSISGIDPGDIQSMTILKDASATSIYGEEGKNGVIILETKQNRRGNSPGPEKVEIKITDSPADESTKEAVNLRFTKDNAPLIILDGEEISRDEMQKISPHDIESIRVLKDKSAAEIYGEKGRNGVVVIEKKK